MNYAILTVTLTQLEGGAVLILTLLFLLPCQSVSVGWAANGRAGKTSSNVMAINDSGWGCSGFRYARRVSRDNVPATTFLIF